MAGIASTVVRTVLERGLWEGRRACRRLLRRFGGAGLAFAFGLAAVIPAWLQWRYAADQLAKTRQTVRLAAEREPQAERAETANGADIGRLRLRQFENHLLPHDNIPDTLQDLFRLADTENLTLQRGEYKVEPDEPGGFVRYRMILPVKGDAQAIYRFIQSALEAHKALALDSVQFRRERIESKDVEARIQWVLLTRLPAAGAGRAMVVGSRP